MPLGTARRLALYCTAALIIMATTPVVAAQPELDVDRRLAREYATPAPELEVTDPAVLPATAGPAPGGFDEAAARRLEQEIDAALAEAEAAENSPRRPAFDASLPTWATSALLSGGILLVTFAAIMVVLVVRQLRNEARQRRRSYRRRVRHRNTTRPAAASAAS
jgi:hypothetical protein